MSTKPDVVIIGAAITDLPLRPVSKIIFDVPSYAIDSMNMSIGGDAINEATVITRLGKNVRLIGAIGNDVAGGIIKKHCIDNGIDTSCIRTRDDFITSTNVILIQEDGERTVVNNRSGSLWTFSIDDINLDDIKDAKILSFASIFNNARLDNSAMVKIFKKAKEEGMIICADMVASRQKETIDDIAEAMSYVDYFFPNYEEASNLSGKTDLDEIADTFINLGVKTVIIKIGKKGAFIKNKDGSQIVPAYLHSNCIDTTGAGDNFAAGFITALLEGKNLKECGQFANVVASISVESIGATEGVKNRTMVDERLEKYKEDFKE